MSNVELDLEQVVLEYRFENLRSDVGWEVEGEFTSPSNDGWRLYLADSSFVINGFFDGQQHQRTDTVTAHVAVNDAGEAALFPAGD